MPKEKVKQFGSQTVFGPAAQPAEIAPIFVFLASDEASYITGETYGVTGGPDAYVKFLGILTHRTPAKLSQATRNVTLRKPFD